MTFRASVVTLFPEAFPGSLALSLTGRALGTAWTLDTHNLRDHATDRHRSVDDTPAGGGAGMVLRADVLASAVEAASPPGDPRPRLLMAARGERLTQARVRTLSEGPGAVIVCGRFEGVDQRAVEALALEEVSVADVVLAGGEVAALLLLEAVVRLLPGVMGNPDSETLESYETGLLEHPHYTKPPLWRGREIPDAIQSGDHAAIARWRMQEAMRITRARRPDLWGAWVSRARTEK